MNIIFDKTNPRLIIKDYPIETTKVELKLSEFNTTISTGAETLVEAGNFSAVLTGTLKALKEETVTILEPVFNELGEQTGNNEVQQVQTTVLEEQAVNLSVL